MRHAPAERSRCLTGWRNTDEALIRLRDAMPAFESEVCLLKCVAVNTLYGTQVMAIVRMANHVHAVLGGKKPTKAGPDLVARIAALPVLNGGTTRTFTSFAAKFCHFFVSENDFPIYDDAARRMLKFHLGKKLMSNASEPYVAFCEDVKRLNDEWGLTNGNRDLDRYLWLSGMYERWLRQRNKKNPVINSELLGMFKKPNKQEARLIHQLLPQEFKRTFKVN
jgi:hypothetical protein